MLRPLASSSQIHLPHLDHPPSSHPDPLSLPVLDIKHPRLCALLDAAQRLTPPSAFAQPSWKADEQAYPLLVHWRQTDALDTLRQLNAALHRIHPGPSQQCDQHELVSALVRTALALARFVSVRVWVREVMRGNPTDDDVEQEEQDNDDEQEEQDNDETDGWIIPPAAQAAREALRTTVRLVLPYLPSLQLATTLLHSYIRPLYHAAAESGPTDPSTGRRRAPAPGETLLVSPSLGLHAAYDEQACWKCSESSCAPVSRTSGTGVLERDAALGNWNVFAFALVLLRCAAEETRDRDVWKQTWFRIVPPLVTLLQDAQLEFRSKATDMVRLLLAPSCAEGEREREGSFPCSLMVSTGILPLIQGAVEANLRLPTDSKGVAVWHRSMHVLLCLVEQVWPRHSEGEFNALFRLLDEGVVRIWSLVSVDATSEVELKVVSTSMVWARRLTNRMGAQRVARFVVEACVKWIVAVAEVEVGAGSARRAAERERGAKDHVTKTLKQVLRTLETVVRFVRQGNEEVVVALAKVYVAFQANAEAEQAVRNVLANMHDSRWHKVSWTPPNRLAFTTPRASQLSPTANESGAQRHGTLMLNTLSGTLGGRRFLFAGGTSRRANEWRASIRKGSVCFYSPQPALVPQRRVDEEARRVSPRSLCADKKVLVLALSALGRLGRPCNGTTEAVWIDVRETARDSERRKERERRGRPAAAPPPPLYIRSSGVMVRRRSALPSTSLQHRKSQRRATARSFS
ncbi:hypothetical protein ACQY0O_006567 [Thecaphora frezii]